MENNKNVKALFEHYMSRVEYEPLFNEGKTDLVEFIKNYKCIDNPITLGVMIQDNPDITIEMWEEAIGKSGKDNLRKVFLDEKEDFRKAWIKGLVLGEKTEELEQLLNEDKSLLNLIVEYIDRLLTGGILLKWLINSLPNISYDEWKDSVFKIKSGKLMCELAETVMEDIEKLRELTIEIAKTLDPPVRHFQPGNYYYIHGFLYIIRRTPFESIINPLEIIVPHIKSLSDIKEFIGDEKDIPINLLEILKKNAEDAREEPGKTKVITTIARRIYL